MIWNLFSRKKRDRSQALYEAIVAAARQPVFYRDWGVPDTVEGRFEMVILHLALIILRLKGQDDELRQQLADRFCLDMDDNLRELGVSDLGVAKKVRRMAEAFQGRYVAYETAHDVESMGQAVMRNVYAGTTATANLAAYAVNAKVLLASEATSEIIAGKVKFR